MKTKLDWRLDRLNKKVQEHLKKENMRVKRNIRKTNKELFGELEENLIRR